MQVLVGLDELLLVGLHDQMAVGADEFPRVILDAQVHILFGVHEDLFLAGQIFEAEFVVVRSPAALGTA